MMTRCVRLLLMLVGAMLLLGALLPVTTILPIPAEYEMAVVSSKLLMLPAGAICLGLAAMLAAKVSRR